MPFTQVLFLIFSIFSSFTLHAGEVTPESLKATLARANLPTETVDLFTSGCDFFGGKCAGFDSGLDTFSVGTSGDLFSKYRVQNSDQMLELVLSKTGISAQFAKELLQMILHPNLEKLQTEEFARSISATITQTVKVIKYEFNEGRLRVGTDRTGRVLAFFVNGDKLLGTHDQNDYKCFLTGPSIVPSSYVCNEQYDRE